MIKVVEKFNLNNGMHVLVCEKFDTSKVTNKLMTERGTVFKPDFEVSPSMGCFSTPKTCDIVIKKKDFDTSGVSMVKFG